MVAEERRRLGRIKANLERRATICQAIRDFFTGQRFLAIDTPVRMPAVAPEYYITPLQSEDWFLCTSPELHMKRLVAAGYNRIFQFSRCFRKKERGRWHNPEFTLLEWYRVNADYHGMVEDTEQMMSFVARRLGIFPAIEYRGRRIDLTPPWPRTTVRDAFLRYAGWDPVAELDCLRFDTDLVDKVMPNLPPDQPSVLHDYPAAMASLAKLKADEPDVAERAEIFIGGLELANAYSELNDPEEQTRRFQKEARRIEQELKRPAPIPTDFLKAVAHLPPCGGIALGLDRLVMLFCNAKAIDEVIPFTEDTA